MGKNCVMPERRRNDRGAARREVILRAATELFAERGFHAVGMRAIADAVGLRSASLYYHFPSKMDMLHAIALGATKQFVESQLPRLEEPGSHAERLLALFRAHVEYFWEHRVEEFVGLRELRELDPPRLEEVNEIRRRYQRALIEFVDEGRAAGEFDVEDPVVSTMAVLNMINGVNEWFDEKGRLTIGQVAQAYAEIAVYRVLGARPPRARKGAAERPRARTRRQSA